MSASSKTPVDDVAETPAASTGPEKESWGWTRGQRLGLGILSAILLLFLVIQFVRRPARVDDPVVMANGEMVSLPKRIDPNTASEAELERIPHVSAKVAGNIIEYRDARKAQAFDGVVFHEPEDLSHIPGITKAVLAQVRPYLQFPEDTADTQPMP